MEYNFDVAVESKNVIEWTRNWMNEKGPDSIAVLGISGGIDSTLTGKILVNAIGPDRVLGVRMPCGDQKDIDDAKLACKELGIDSIEINIGSAYDALTIAICSAAWKNKNFMATEQYSTNTPARIRMATLYGLAGMLGNAYPVNTCNMSETAEGYDTIFGDSAGSLAPIAMLTKTEVRAIAKYLGLPERLYNKTSIDGMSVNDDGTYKADEDKLGFTYAELDTFLREGKVGPNNDKIVTGMKKSVWKRKLISIEHFEPNLPFFAKSLWDSGTNPEES